MGQGDDLNDLGSFGEYSGLFSRTDEACTEVITRRNLRRPLSVRLWRVFRAQPIERSDTKNACWEQSHAGGGGSDSP